MSSSSDDDDEDIDLRAAQRFAKLTVSAPSQPKPQKSKSTTKKAATKSTATPATTTTNASKRLLALTQQSILAASSHHISQETEVAAPVQEKKKKDNADKEEDENDKVAFQAALDALKQGHISEACGLFRQVSFQDISLHLQWGRECESRELTREAIRVYYSVLSVPELDPTIRVDVMRVRLPSCFANLGISANNTTGGLHASISPLELEAQVAKAMTSAEGVDQLEVWAFSNPRIVAEFVHSQTGLTCLHVAAIRNRREMIHQLIEKGGAKWETKDCRGWNSLLWSLFQSKDNDDDDDNIFFSCYGATLTEYDWSIIRTWSPELQNRVKQLCALHNISS